MIKLLLEKLSKVKVGLFIFGLFCYGFLFFGCVKNTVKPVINPQASQAEREQAYKDYKLNFHGDTFLGSFGFTQGTNTTSFMYWQVGPVINEISPKGGKYLSEGNGNYFLSRIFLGGGIVGIALPLLDMAMHQGQMAKEGWLVLGGGIACMVVSYLFSDAATSSYKSAVKEYNKALKEKLNVEDTGVEVSINLRPLIMYNIESSEIEFYTQILTVNF